MNRLFNNVVVSEDNKETIQVETPTRGFETLISINGISVERIKALAKELSPEYWKTELNSLLQGVMAMTESPLENEVRVEVEIDPVKTEVFTLPFNPHAKAEAMDAVKANFEGIRAVAKAAGFSEREINVLFAATVIEFQKAASIGNIEAPDEMADLMGNMMNNMMGGVAGAGGMPNMANNHPGMGQAQNCEAQ